MLIDNFFRVAAGCPAVRPADVDFNVESIIGLMKQLDAEGVKIAVFPELCVTGYTCGDLFLSQQLQSSALEGVRRIAEATSSLRTAFVIGYPLAEGANLYNVAAVLHRGSVNVITGKKNIPNYGEFYEKRWFKAWDGETRFINIDGVMVGVEICEDLWVPNPPSTSMALNGAEVLLNLSASNDVAGKYDYLIDMIKQQSARCVAAYVYAGAGYGESSTDLVFDAKAIIAENGKLLEKNDRWTTRPTYVIADIDIEALEHDRRHKGEFMTAWNNNQIEITTGIEATDSSAPLHRHVEQHPFVPSGKEHRNERCDELTHIQALGLARRLEATGCKTAVIGISGGLDSTLALLVTCSAFDMLHLDRKGIIGVTMPGFGTTSRTKNNALTMCRLLGVTTQNISIVEEATQHFKDIGHDMAVHDVTYENVQARIRTLLLMNLANKHNGMVIGTGDLSEAALGWATYNGDHMSMYNVNAGVPKTLVRYLIEWYAEIQPEGSSLREVLLDIINTPISPELLPPNADGTIAQITEDRVGPYELHDFFLYYTLRYGMGPRRIFVLAKKAFGDRYDDAVLLKWLRVFFKRFFAQQFKRSCMPDGPKVGSVCLSPRGDWRMPSDASSALWLNEITKLEKEIL